MVMAQRAGTPCEPHTVSSGAGVPVLIVPHVSPGAAIG